jgi:peptidase S41-like protein/tricorn protease-like protein
MSVSCELLFMAPVPDTTPHAIFEQTWRFADQEYSFFEYKTVDWQATYDTFQPQVRSDMDDEELFTLLAEMLYGLRDGHVNLRSPFDSSRNWQWFLDYDPNFDYTLLERNYFNDQQQYIGPFVVYDFGDIVYVYYRSFSSSFTQENLDYLLATFADRDGIIFDVRGNGGGALSNAFQIANRLVDGPTDVGRERFKNGPAHDSFTPYEPVRLAPPPGSEPWLKPFVVLTNRSCYSATNFFVAMIRDLEQVTVIGDSTGGGGGIPSFTELTNGWYLRVSAHQYHTIAEFEPGETNIENGLPPDLQVDIGTDPVVDGILVAALNYIRGL